MISQWSEIPGLENCQLQALLLYIEVEIERQSHGHL